MSELTDDRLEPCPFCGWAFTADEGLCKWDKDEFGDTVDEITYTGVCCPGCSAFVPINAKTAAEAIAAWNRRRAAASTGTEGVKALEWGEDHPYPDAPWSKNYLHQRIGHHNLGRYAGSYSVFECPDGKWGWATTWDDTPRVLTGSFGTEAEAQAAAQADFERRILSCLTPPAPKVTTDEAEERG